MRFEACRLILCGYGETAPSPEGKPATLLPHRLARGADARISVFDIATGARGHAAILEAPAGRRISGLGADIRVSTGYRQLLAVPLLHCENGTPAKRIGMAHPSILPYGMFTTPTARRS